MAVTAEQKQERITRVAEKVAQILVTKGKARILAVGFNTRTNTQLTQTLPKELRRCLRTMTAGRFKKNQPEVDFVFTGHLVDHALTDLVHERYGREVVELCLNDHGFVRAVLTLAATKAGEIMSANHQAVPPQTGSAEMSKDPNPTPKPENPKGSAVLLPFGRGMLKNFVENHAGTGDLRTKSVATIAADLLELAHAEGYTTTLGSMANAIHRRKQELNKTPEESPKPLDLPDNPADGELTESEHDREEILSALQVLGVKPETLGRLTSIVHTSSEVEELRRANAELVEANSQLDRTVTDLQETIRELEARLRDIHQRSAPVDAL